MKTITKLNFLIKTCLYRRKALSLLERRRNLDMFDYLKSSEEIPINYFFASTIEEDKFSDFYSIARWLKIFAGISQDTKIPFHIEHGVFFDESSYNGELNSPFEQIIVPGDFRVEVLKSEYGKKATAIGPYIAYVESFLTLKQAERLKHKSGKTLTVFPVHSTETVQYKYDIDQYCEGLLKLKQEHKFKTVRICLFYKDILKNVHREYQKHGFEIVSAGHMFDPQFLPRLRSVIETSDITCSNAMGTQLAYCVYLKKPHFIQNQELSCIDPTDEISKESWDAYYSSNDILEAFSTYSQKISKKQYELLDFYCGFSRVLGKKWLRELLTKAK